MLCRHSLFAVPLRRLARLSRSMSVESAMRAKLIALLDPVELNIINDSSKHAGHAGVRGDQSGETHFTVECISEQFADKKLMQRHRMIYAALGDELKAGLHALVLRTKTPEEAGMSADEVKAARVSRQ